MGFVEFFEFGGFGGVEFEVEGSDGIEKVLFFTGSDDGTSDSFVREDPGEGEASSGDASSCGDFGDAVGDLEIVFAAIDLLGVEVGLGAEAVFAVAFKAASEEAAAEGRPRDHPEALIEAEGDHLALFFTVGEVVVILHGDEFRRAGFVCCVVELRELPGKH